MSLAFRCIMQSVVCGYQEGDLFHKIYDLSIIDSSSDLLLTFRNVCYYFLLVLFPKHSLINCNIHQPVSFSCGSESKLKAFLAPCHAGTAHRQWCHRSLAPEDTAAVGWMQDVCVWLQMYIWEMWMKRETEREEDRQKESAYIMQTNLEEVWVGAS